MKETGVKTKDKDMEGRFTRICPKLMKVILYTIKDKEKANICLAQETCLREFGLTMSKMDSE